MTEGPAMQAFHSLAFDDLFVRTLPPDPSRERGVRQVYGACYSLVQPTPVADPRLLAWSESAAQQLGIQSPGQEAAAILAGNRLLPGMQPYAACYGGHQFGNWAGQLGDGRAITLGEVINPQGQRWEVQLKGAGPTPYSRRADGLAVLRSSIREFLCSEAMFHLGVPTTRALALVGTGQSVLRDMFYDGNPRYEPGAVVTRLAPTFMRFGNFEIFARRGEPEPLARLLDYVITQYFPELGAASPGRTLDWFSEVCRRTAVMVAEWMRVGFVHGVMNTDNLSVLGLTIDYGPYGWLDPYQPHFTPNTTDQGLRYCYAQQPAIAQWNLARLAEALLTLGGEAEQFEERLELFHSTFTTHYRTTMLAKLGLPDGPQNTELLDELLSLMSRAEIDMTLFFRGLAEVTQLDDPLPGPLLEALYRPLNGRDLESLRTWVERYLRQAGPDPQRTARMKKVNPSIIPRNYLVQQVIDKAEAGDYQPINDLLLALQNPYEDRPPDHPLVQKRPDWARNKAGCSALSCSS